MKSYFPVSFLHSLGVVISLGLGGANAADFDQVIVRSKDGFHQYHKKSFEVQGILPFGWTAQVHTVYCPLKGLGGSGWNAETNWVDLDGLLMGFEFYPGYLHASISTNTYPVGLTDPTSVFAAELSRFTNGPRRLIRVPQYRIDLKQLLRRAIYRVIDSPQGTMYPTQGRPSQWQGVSVQNGNAVVTILIGSETQAKVAFDSRIRPVWATTNGVSIGLIPTNVVFFTDLVNGREVVKTVY